MADLTPNEALKLFGAIASEIEEMERPFEGSSLFKYLPIERRSFFRNSRIRFTQKSALNDPFELTKRWNEFASPAAQSALSAFIEKEIEGSSMTNLFYATMRSQTSRKGYVVR